MGIDERANGVSKPDFRSHNTKSAEGWLDVIEKQDYKALKLSNGDGHPLWLDEADGVYHMLIPHSPRLRTARGMSLERDDLIDHIQRCEVEVYEIPRTYAIDRGMVSQDAGYCSDWSRGIQM